MIVSLTSEWVRKSQQSVDGTSRWSRAWVMGLKGSFRFCLSFVPGHAKRRTAKVP
jgi:hypothetical protein